MENQEDSSFIARIREQQAQEAAERSRKNMKDRFLRWEKGQEYNVRVLPSDDPTKFPYVMGSVHYGLVRPRPCSGNKNCPLCKVVAHWRTQGYDRHENKIKELGAKLKGFYKVVVREFVQPGKPLRNAIKFMSHNSLANGKQKGKGVHDKILALFLKPGAESKGHPASVYNGFDLRIDLPEASPGYDFEASRDNTALMETQEQIDEVLKISREEFDLYDCIAISAEETAEIEEIAKQLMSGELKVSKYGGGSVQDEGDVEVPATAVGDALKEPPYCIGNPQKREEYRDNVCTQCNFAGECDHRIKALGGSKVATPEAHISETPPPSKPSSGAASTKPTGPSLEDLEKQHEEKKGHKKGSK